MPDGNGTSETVMRICFLLESLDINGGNYVILQHAQYLSRAGMDKPYDGPDEVMYVDDPVVSELDEDLAAMRLDDRDNKNDWTFSMHLSRLALLSPTHDDDDSGSLHSSELEGLFEDANNSTEGVPSSYAPDTSSSSVDTKASAVPGDGKKKDGFRPEWDDDNEEVRGEKSKRKDEQQKAHDDDVPALVVDLDDPQVKSQSVLENQAIIRQKL